MRAIIEVIDGYTSLHDASCTRMSNEWTQERMDAWTHGRMDAWTHGRMDAWTHGRTDAGAQASLLLAVNSSTSSLSPVLYCQVYLSSTFQFFIHLHTPHNYPHQLMPLLQLFLRLILHYIIALTLLLYICTSYIL